MHCIVDKEVLLWTPKVATHLPCSTRLSLSQRLPVYASSSTPSASTYQPRRRLVTVSLPTLHCSLYI